MDWPVVIPTDHTAEWEAVSDAERAAAKMTAVAILHGASGQSIGLITYVVRPTPDVARSSTYYRGASLRTSFPSGLVGSVDDLVNEPRCDAATVTLDGPVHAVTDVRVAGQVFDPDAYRVDGDRLVRVDGTPWPTGGDLPDTDPQSLVVTYQRGIAADADAQLAAGLLALEVLRGANGDGACRLPPNARNVARQGMTVEIDPVAFLEAGLTGVPFVDQWIRRINPHQVTAAPTIVIPERRR